MRVGMTSALVCAFVAGVGVAQAQDYERRPIGDWLVTATADRFGDGGSYNALSISGSKALVVRCLQRKLSFMVMQVDVGTEPFSVGDKFKLKVKLDERPIVEIDGIAPHARLLLIQAEPDLVRSVRDSHETAVRVQDDRGGVTAYVFKTAGGAQAFADLSRECPLD